MHDSEFSKECHLLAPIVGFSHSEKTLVSTKWEPSPCEIEDSVWSCDKAVHQCEAGADMASVADELVE
jgi:hypothetical protein